MKSVINFTKKYSIMLVLFALVILFGALRPESFFTVKNLFAVLRQVSITGIMTVGVLIVMLAGGLTLRSALLCHLLAFLQRI